MVTPNPFLVLGDFDILKNCPRGGGGVLVLLGQPRSSLHRKIVEVIRMLNLIILVLLELKLSQRNTLRIGYCNAAVVPSVSTCVPSRFDLVIMIETKPLCAYSSNVADMFSMKRE